MNIKAIIILLFFLYFFSFSCNLRITEITPSFDILEITNFDSGFCSGNLILTGNLRNKEKYTIRKVDNFVLSWYSVALLSNDCSTFSWYLCYSFDKHFRVFNDIDLHYSIFLNNDFVTGYYLKSDFLQKWGGSLSLILSWWRYIWFWTGSSLWKFDYFFDEKKEFKEKNWNFCYINLDSVKDNIYIFSFTGNSSWKVKWYVNGHYIDSWLILSKSFYTGEYLIEARIYSWENILCRSFYSILNRLKYKKVEKLIFKDIFTGSLKINEIHPFDDKLPEYIEIKALGNWSGKVNIIWLWKWKAIKSLNFILYSGQLAVITDKIDLFSWFNISKLIHLDNISLTDKWEELILTDGSGNVLDKVIYKNWEKWKSLYFRYKSGDLRIFDKIDISTPGIQLSILKSFLSKSKKSTFLNFWIKLQNSIPIYSDNSINLIAVFSWKELSNKEKNYECKWYIDNKLFFTWCNPPYKKFNYVWVLPIRLDLKDKLNNIVYQTIYYLNSPKKISCRCSNSSNYYELYKKRKFRYYELKNRVKEQKKSQYIYLSGLVKIEYVLPNPKWRDIWNEEIGLKFLKDVVLSWKILKIKNRKYFLTGIWHSWQVMALKKDFKLPNMWGCIYLFSGKNILLDKFCYLKAVAWQKIYRNLWFDFTDNLLNFKYLKLYQSGKNFCVLFSGQTLFCKKIKLSKISRYISLKEKYKNLKKDYVVLQEKYKSYKKKVKKTVKFIDKYLRKLYKVVINYNKKILKLYDKLAKISKKFDSYKMKVKVLKDKYKTYRSLCKNEKNKIKIKVTEKMEYYKKLYNKAKEKGKIYYYKYRLYKAFAQIVKSKIKNKWKPLWDKEWLNRVENQLEEASALISSWYVIDDFKRFLNE